MSFKENNPQIPSDLKELIEMTKVILRGQNPKYPPGMVLNAA
jgi:hypothetical protein